MYPPHVHTPCMPHIASQSDHSVLCVVDQATSLADEAGSEVTELQSKLSTAQRKAQRHEQDMAEAEALRAGLLEQLGALRADAQALQASLEHTQHDRQKVSTTDHDS